MLNIAAGETNNGKFFDLLRDLGNAGGAGGGDRGQSAVFRHHATHQELAMVTALSTARH
jgi:hypothetical protein